MEPVLIVLYSLLSSSLLLCVALGVAWRRFGRELHAALWALAYGLSAANWSFSLLTVWLHSDNPALTMMGAICMVGSFALIALGFRRRAGLPTRIDAILAAALVTILFVAVGLARPTVGAQRWLVLFYCAGMLMVSAQSLRGAKARARVGRGAFWLLSSFAAYTVGLGVLAVLIPTSGDATPMLRLFRLVVLLGVPVGLIGVGLFAMFLLAVDLAEGMRALASSDPLTGILNRRGLEQAAESAIALCRRGDRPLTLILVDLDHFKGVNDRFGHAGGDAVLKRFAEHATASLRQGDLLGRLGGEEFVFVLPDTNVARAMDAMERFRRTLPSVTGELAPDYVLTASFGIAAVGGGEDTLSRALERADGALYRSKSEGRDRITIAPPEATPVGRRRVDRRPRPFRA